MENLMQYLILIGVIAATVVAAIRKSGKQQDQERKGQSGHGENFPFPAAIPMNESYVTEKEVVDRQETDYHHLRSQMMADQNAVRGVMVEEEVEARPLVVENVRSVAGEKPDLAKMIIYSELMNPKYKEY